MTDKSEQMTKEILDLVQSLEPVKDHNPTLVAKIKKLIEKELDVSKPKCNQCAEVIGDNAADRWNSTKVSVDWGFESTGKDTDHDEWSLCSECTKNLLDKHPITCNFCKRSIAEVMADIDSRNPHCTNFGNYNAALAHHLGDKHCGEEYAQIKDRVICEWCYDEITAKFSIPINSVNYHIVSGNLYDNNHHSRVNRTAQALEIKKGDVGDSLRERYKSVVTYEEVLTIRSLDNPEKRLVRVSVEIYREKYRKDFEDVVTLETGCDEYYSVPCSWFDSKARGFDFTKPSIFHQGQALVLGDYQIDFKLILAEFKPVTRETD